MEEKTPRDAVPVDGISALTNSAQVAPTSMFDMVKANGLVDIGNWDGLDGYLCSFLSEHTKESKDDVAVSHPNLILIPRKIKVIHLMESGKLEDAKQYFSEAIEPLKECSSKYKTVSLVEEINKLSRNLKTKRVPVMLGVDSAKMALDCYFRLYFPGLISDGEGVEPGLWQFAMKVPEGSNHRIRCLACNWITPDSYNISNILNHLVHSPGSRHCEKVTADILQRLKSMDDSWEVPVFTALKGPSGQLKRKSTSAESTNSSGPSLTLGKKSKLSCADVADIGDADPTTKNPDRLQAINSTSAEQSTNDSSGASLTLGKKSKLSGVHVADIGDADPTTKNLDRLQAINSAVSCHLLKYKGASWSNTAFNTLTQSWATLEELRHELASPTSGVFVEVLKDPVLEKMESLQSGCNVVLTQLCCVMEPPSDEKCVSLLQEHSEVLLDLRSSYIRSRFLRPEHSAGHSDALLSAVEPECSRGCFCCWLSEIPVV